MITMLITDDAVAQRRKSNYYKRMRKKNKKISRYRGNLVMRQWKNHPFVGINVNAVNYFGDLAPVSRAASTEISFTRPGFGIFYGYRFNPGLAVRGSFDYGRMIGDDNTSSADPEAQGFPRYVRNLSFRNDIKELTLGLEFYFLQYHTTPTNGYIFIGGAFFHHQPKGQVPQYDYQLLGPNVPPNAEPLPNAGEWVNLRDLRTEGQGQPGREAIYSNWEFAIPVSVGVFTRLPGNFQLAFELSYRFMWTDHLDDVSGTYADLGSFDSDLARIMSDRSVEPVAILSGEPRSNFTPVIQSFNGVDHYISGYIGSGVEGSQRGNADNNDMYFLSQIKLTYNLPPTRRRTAKTR
jgi:hypothetical protein